MRVLLLTHDTTAPPSLLTALAARGHEIRIAAGKPAAAGSEGCGVVLVCGADAESAAVLCRQVRACPEGERCYLVATFPGADLHSLLPLLAAGADDALPDPAAPELLDLRLAVAESAALRRVSFLVREEVERAHQESEERYRSLFDGVPVGLYRTTPKGDLRDVNAALVRLLGYPDRESLLAANTTALYLDPEDRLRWQRAVEAEETAQTVEVRLRRRDGEVIWGRFTVRGVRDEEGRVILYEGALEDVTDQKRAEEALRSSEERFRALVQNASDMIAILSADGRVLYGSPSHERVLGLDMRLQHQPPILDFVHPDDRARVQGLLDQLLARPGEILTLESRIRHADGSYRVIETTASNLLSHPAVLGIVLNSHDITDRKRAEERLLHDALHDELTGLPNRAYFMERLRSAMARSRREPERLTAVLFLDVDRFKLVNDSLGHSAGDSLLTQVAAALASALRPSDTISRMGGDEFAILLEGGRDVEDAVSVAERIHERLTAPVCLAGHEVPVTASLGVAVCTPDYEHPENLLRDADTAMYRAKAAGRARHVVFEPGMEPTVAGRFER